MVCNSGIRFDPLLQTQPLAFDFYGLYDGVVTMIDRNTKSVWLQVGGRAIKGIMTGTALKTAPMLDTTWKRWRQLHPDTKVMSPDNPYKNFYEAKGETPRGYTAFPSPYFEQSMSKRRRDSRLPTFEMVLAVMANDGDVPLMPDTDSTSPKSTTKHYRAYPLKVLRHSTGVLNDKIGLQSLSVFYDAESKSAVAFSRLLDGKMLTFEMRKQSNGTLQLCDTETQSCWTIEGKAISGDLAGKQLTPLNSYLSEWYGWAAYFPQTTIYGQLDKQKVVTQTKTSLRP